MHESRINFIYFIERSRAENHLRESLLGFLSSMLDEIPYGLPEKSFSYFHQQLQFQRQDVQQWDRYHQNLSLPVVPPALLAEVQAFCQTVYSRRRDIYHLLKNVFASLYKQVNSKTTQEICHQLMTALKTAHSILKHTRMPSIAWQEDYRVAHRHLQEQWKKWYTHITRYKKKALDVYTVKMMQADDFPARLKMNREEFLLCKYQQHHMIALQQRMGQVDRLLSPQKLIISPAQQWLTKTDYTDLLWLSEWIYPFYQKDCLTHKIHLYEEILETLYTSAQLFISYWKTETSNILRLYRTLQFYHRWEKTFLDHLQRLGNLDYPDWRTLLAFHSLLSYDKKAFFKQALAQENAIPLFQSLKQLLEDHPALREAQKAYTHFQQEKQILQHRLRQRQTQAAKTHKRWEKCVAFLASAIAAQPTFQLAVLSYDVQLSSLHYLEQQNPAMAATANRMVDQLCERYLPRRLTQYLHPQRDLQFIRAAAGMTAFALDQWCSSWFGYTYRSIAAINHVFQAQFDTWVSLGQKWETLWVPLVKYLQQLTPEWYQAFIQTCGKHLRLDEIGLLEKEASIQWMTGLGIHLLMQNSELLMPAFIGYVTATALSGGAMRLVESIGQKRDFTQRTLAFFKYMVHATVYSYSYVYSFHLGRHFLSSDPLEMTEAKALSIFGFYKRPTEPTLIKKRYYVLARQYHPDKCAVQCSESSVTLSENVIAENSQRCLTHCQEVNTEKMHEIHRAYNFLKR